MLLLLEMKSTALLREIYENKVAFYAKKWLYTKNKRQNEKKYWVQRKRNEVTKITKKNVAEKSANN